MPIDRASTLKAAEKLLRQGKLDQAIAEYLRVVEEQPSDWNTANLTGDLYVRAGKPDKAIELFVASADSLSDEGALPKASALYKKILKLRPEHEHALLQCAEIAATQGVLVDARSYLRAVADRRQARGDQRGVAQITIRLASLDPHDLAARLAGARARLTVRDQAGAVRDLKEIAAEMRTQDRSAEAIDVLREAIALAPDDHEVRHQLLEAFVAAGDHVSAREHARTAEQLQMLAAHFEEQGRHEEGTALLEQALAIDPSNARLLARLNRTPAPKTAGESPGGPPSSGDDVAAPGSAPTLADQVQGSVQAGRLEEALHLVRGLLACEPHRRDEVTGIGLDLCHGQCDVAFALVDMAADAAVAEQDYASAAAGLQELVTRVPMYIPALMRLVEVCVDGGLEGTMYGAQAQLVDAYLEAGAAEEARFIAEDLVAREPWERANIERFRRALELLGEPDPDARIAARLSGDEPFTSTDVSISVARGDMPAPDVDGLDPVTSDDHAFEFSSATFDASDPPEDDDEGDPAEVDLSVALSGLEPSGVPPAGVGDLEGVLGQLRHDAARRSAVALAEEEYARALALRASGQVDECVVLLKSASRTPNLRFVTAALLGRIYQERGDAALAMEWLERAAQAPPPNPDDGRLLMYDLADVLEKAGEYTRALAVCMELQADAGVYRDVADRVNRLTSMQIRG